MSKNNTPSQEELIEAANKAASTKEQNRAERKGNLIYQPKGPAGEYAKWAINLYNGCSNGCTYCYNRRGVMSHAFGDKPKLAAPIAKLMERKRIKEFKARALQGLPAILSPDVEKILNRKFLTDAIVEIIDEDIVKGAGVRRLREDGGVFFSFKCDPMDADTHTETLIATDLLVLQRGIPVTILTKNTEWLEDVRWQSLLLFEPSDENCNPKKLLTIGFTITGMDEMEPNAPSTNSRINALQQVRAYGYKSFVSMEPVVRFDRARTVLMDIVGETDEIRIGLQSPYKKDRYDIGELMDFLRYLVAISRNEEEHGTRIVLKNSFMDERLYKHIPAHLHDDYMELINEIKCNEPIK